MTKIEINNAQLQNILEMINNLPESNGNTDFINWLANPTATTLIIPEGAIKIGDAAFRNIYSIFSIQFPSSLASIGTQAFRGCTNLAGNIDLKNIITIYSAAFRDSTKITSLNLGNKLEDIRDNAFRGLTLITDIEFPGTLNRIQSNAFYGCSALQTVTFIQGNKNYPNGGLAADIFNDCTALTDIYVYWNSGEVANAPWGAPTGCKIHYADTTVTV